MYSYSLKYIFNASAKKDPFKKIWVNISAEFHQRFQVISK